MEKKSNVAEKLDETSEDRNPVEKETSNDRNSGELAYVSGKAETENVQFSLNLDYKNLTEGQKAVGITFNPSGDKNVMKVKLLSAELIDTVIANHKSVSEKREVSYLRNIFKTQAINCLITAQMAVVKVLTWKD